jgi:hypothetical protein
MARMFRMIVINRDLHVILQLLHNELYPMALLNGGVGNHLYAKSITFYLQK